MSTGSFRSSGNGSRPFGCQSKQLSRDFSASLACRNRRERPLIDGLLWRVGTFDWANQDVAVYLATRIATLDEAQRCAAAISAEPRAGFRVLLTPDLDNMRDFEIAGCAIAKLSDAISIDPVLGLEARPYRCREACWWSGSGQWRQAGCLRANAVRVDRDARPGRSCRSRAHRGSPCDPRNLADARPYGKDTFRRHR